MNDERVDLLSRLAAGSVKFVLIGGYACLAHGGTVSTEDVDVCLDFSTDNLLRLQKSIEDLHPVHRMTPKRLPLLLTPENCQHLKNLYLDTDLGQLDCIGYVAGLGEYAQVEQMSQTIETEGVQFKLLNRDALIKSKKAMNRWHDQKAIAQLESLNKIEENEKQTPYGEDKE